MANHIIFIGFSNINDLPTTITPLFVPVYNDCPFHFINSGNQLQKLLESFSCDDSLCFCSHTSHKVIPGTILTNPKEVIPFPLFVEKLKSFTFVSFIVCGLIGLQSIVRDILNVQKNSKSIICFPTNNTIMLGDYFEYLSSFLTVDFTEKDNIFKFHIKYSPSEMYFISKNIFTIYGQTLHSIVDYEMNSSPLSPKRILKCQYLLFKNEINEIANEFNEFPFVDRFIRADICDRLSLKLNNIPICYHWPTILTYIHNESKDRIDKLCKNLFNGLSNYPKQ